MRLTAVLLVLALAMPALVRAQGSERPAQPSVPAASVDVSRMGVSLERIRRELRQEQLEEQRNGEVLKLSFTIEVYGEAPRIDLLKDFPLIGPVPYGAPTHQEIVDFLTPKEYRSPVIPFSAIASWAAQKLSERSKRQRCEEELAEYKRLVMAGVAVAAPRCAQ